MFSAVKVREVPFPHCDSMAGRVVVSVLKEANEAWEAASAAMDGVCRALASVPGSAAEFAEMNALADRVQAEGSDILQRALAASRKHAVASLPPEWRTST